MERRDGRRRDRLESELEAELQFDLEARAAAHRAAGLPPEEARRRARLDLGGLEGIREACRDERRGAFLTTLLLDARFGLRLLRRSPGFAAVALLTLAIGVGACTVLFSIADAALLKPLPFLEPDQLVRVWDTNPGKSIPRIGVTTGNVADWRSRARTLDGLAAWYVMGRTLYTGDEAVVVETAQVSTDFFQVFRVPPALGRTFTPEETDRATYNSAAAPTGADPVVVISDRLWRRRFGADPEIVGRAITLERQPWRVVGVMPARFSMPGESVDAWIPWSFAGDLPRDQHYLQAVARLAHHADLDEAAADLNGIAAALEAEFPPTNEGWRVALVPLHEEIAGGARQVLLILLAGVGLVILVTCANLAGLQVVRAIRRGRETALRLALGASRARLVRQHLTESGLLAGLGGLLGLLFAALALAVLRARAGAGIPRLAEATLDLRVAAAAGGVILVTVVASGLVPALFGVRAGKVAGLGESGRATEPPGSRRWRNLFVAGQVAAAFVLLAGAGLLVRSYGRLMAVDPGFAADRVLVAPVFLDNRTYATGDRTRAYYAAVESRLAAIPGVESVGAATALPTSPLGPDFERPVWAGERPAAPPEEQQQADVRMATPRYFATLGMRLVRGRPFGTGDGPGSPRVLAVSESLARRLWPGADPIGQRLTVDYSTAGTPSFEVVAVVGDIRFRGLRSEPRHEIYLPHAQRSYLIMNVAVRTAGDPAAFVAAVRQGLRDVDPMQPAHAITPLARLVGATVDRDRFAMRVVLAFALTALVLSIVGLYGVLSYGVRQRRTEIGVRMALGAGRGSIVGMILGEGMRILLAGLAAGLVAALMVTRGLGSLLFGIDARDPATLAAVALLLALTAILAALVPARRAAGIEPAIALRHD